MRQINLVEGKVVAEGLKTGLRAGDFTCCLHEVRGENRWNRTDSGGKYSGCDSARGEKLEGSCGKRTGV